MHVFLCAVCCWMLFVSNQANKTINIYAISNLQITYGRIIVAAQRLAFEYINNNERDILSNYTLNLTLLDAEEDTTVALQRVFQIMNTIQNGQSKDIVLPIVLGCPYSSLSSITAPALGAIKWAQISSLATSISLSDTSRYPTFYRTIAADSLQSAGIIGLLEYFGWTKFAIIYVNDVYGIYLTIEIMRLASTHTSEQFDISPIAYTTQDIESIKSAAAQISNTFITVLIVHDADINPLYTELEKRGRWGYPYFYIGVDAWFDDTVIEIRNVARFTQGYLGTAPWGSHMLTRDDYSEQNTGSIDLQTIYDVSSKNYQRFGKLWHDKYADDPDFLYNLDSPSALSNYGFDTVYTIAYVIQNILDINGSLDGLLTTPMQVIDDIITDKISFIGITGNVSYKENGDRDKALFAYGNILGNGSISWVGYFSDFYDVTYLNFDGIIWPKDFVDKNMIPRSDVLVTDSLIAVDNDLWITMTFFSVVSMCVVIVYVILTFYCSGEKIMKAASWRLNIVSCIGCIIAYIYVIIIGLNETKNYSLNELNAICAIQPWFICISFTLVFMPLFLKTYRISVIFTKILKKMVLTDTLLLIAIGICVLIDILLLIIFTAISAQQRLYRNGVLEVVDELQQTQYIYAICQSPDDNVNYTFFGVMGAYKLVQLFFGIYCCLIVSRIGISEIRKFDETSTQLVAIIISISLFILTLIIIAFMTEYKTNWLYAIQSVVILIIGNVCLAFNLCPRFIAIFNGDEDRYKTTPEEEINKYIQAKLEELFKKNGGVVAMESLKSIVVEETTNSLKAMSNDDKTDTYCD